MNLNKTKKFYILHDNFSLVCYTFTQIKITRLINIIGIYLFNFFKLNGIILLLSFKCILLPLKKKLIILNTSPHVYKNAREKYYKKPYKLKYLFQFKNIVEYFNIFKINYFFFIDNFLGFFFSIIPSGIKTTFLIDSIIIKKK